MKRDTVNYLVVGLFVGGVAMAFLVLMHFVTGRAGPSDLYHAFYDNVAGVKFGTGVFYEGYRVGQVEEIEPTPAPTGMRYKVSFSVAKDWRIPVDSVAEVIAAGLIAQVQIQIQEGRSTEHLRPGAEIRGVQHADLFSALSEAATGFSDLSESGVGPVLRNLDRRISQVADEFVTFRRDELSPLVRNLDTRVNGELAPQATRVLGRLETSAARLEHLLGPTTDARVGRLLDHADEAAVQLTHLLAAFDGTRRRMDAALVRLDALVAANENDLAGSITHARSSLEKMDTTLTTIAEDIDTLMYNLSGGARQMHELARELRANPSRILRSPEPVVEGTP
ncbi:MAG: MlaD family protein [Gammaproteobacteria bacterium]